MNPNLRELGNAAFNADGSYNIEIQSCLSCQFFKSYRAALNAHLEPVEFGFCEFPFMLVDETYGLGSVCDFFEDSHQ